MSYFNEHSKPDRKQA